MAIAFLKEVFHFSTCTYHPSSKFLHSSAFTFTFTIILNSFEVEMSSPLAHHMPHKLREQTTSLVSNKMAPIGPYIGSSHSNNLQPHHRPLSNSSPVLEQHHTTFPWASNNK